MARILILAAERIFAVSLKDSLDFDGFETQISGDSRDGIYRALNETFDLILFDSRVDGNAVLSTLKEIRKTNKDMPIIVLSDREKEEDVVFALNLGADDYLSIPFSTAELIARIRAQIRRMNVLRGYGGSSSNDGSHPGYEPVNLKIGEAIIFLDKMTAKNRENESALTPKEIGILRLLYKNRGKVVSREMMMREIWTDESYITERVIDTNIVSIRKKIGDAGRKARYIKTVFGVGYKLIDG